MRIETKLIKIDEFEQLFESFSPPKLETAYLFEIRQLAFALVLSSDSKGNSNRNDRDTNDYNEKPKPLNRFKANLIRRKTNNPLVTNRGISQIPEPYRAILKSDIAYAFRDEINDYTEIDFAKERHNQLLHVALNNSIAKVNKLQGRPVNKALMTFFIGLRNLYEAASGEQASACAHFDEQPCSNFEKHIYLGYQLVRGSSSYPSALRAYERSIARYI